MDFTVSSALHRVPLEIWTNIFLDCLPDRRFITPNCVTAPLMLCNICRRWRAVARSTPKLWSSIHVEVSLGCDVKKVVKGVALWLSRSGTRPLAISFTWNGNPQRARSYYLGQPLPHETDPFPWLQLCRFVTQTRSNTTWEEFLYILQRSPNITSGLFKIRSEAAPTPFLAAPVVHEQLTDLDLSINAKSMSNLLEYVTLPALHSFAIRGIDVFEFWPHGHFVAFLSRLRSPLQRLKLSDTLIGTSELIEILCLTPALTNLYVEGWSSMFLGNEFFQALTLHEDNQEEYLHLCPRLETLTLHTTFMSSDGVLADMVESRYNLDVQGFTKLRSVNIALTWDWVETCDHKRLEALCGKGLVIFVQAHTGATATAWDEDPGGGGI